MELGGKDLQRKEDDPKTGGSVKKWGRDDRSMKAETRRRGLHGETERRRWESGRVDGTRVRVWVGTTGVVGRGGEKTGVGGDGGVGPTESQGLRRTDGRSGPKPGET